MASTDTARPNRPRTQSMLSFGSRKSSGSGPKSPKLDLTETSREKMSRRITGKADPMVAMSELQPSVRAHEQSTMQPLRSMQHRDSFGNVINDPDRSNPTRPRMERPLDTIRSFEAAIDSGYSRRYSAQPDTQSRRASYHQGFAAPTRTPGAGNGYFERQPISRPDSMYGENDRGYPQIERGYPNGGHHGHGQQRRYPPRNQSEPIIYGANGTYGNTGPSPVSPVVPPQAQWTHPALAQSTQDNTTTSTSGSYATDRGTNSTEASLHNSSYGELPQQQQQFKPQPPPHEGFANGLAQGQSGLTDGHGQQYYGNTGAASRQYEMAPPPPPAHGRSNGNTLRKPMQQLQQQQQDVLPPVPQHNSSAAPARPAAEKRKSWLARRFSKHG